MQLVAFVAFIAVGIAWHVAKSAYIERRALALDPCLLNLGFGRTRAGNPFSETALPRHRGRYELLLAYEGTWNARAAWIWQVLYRYVGPEDENQDEDHLETCLIAKIQGTCPDLFLPSRERWSRAAQRGRPHLLRPRRAGVNRYPVVGIPLASGARAWLLESTRLVSLAVVDGYAVLIAHHGIEPELVEPLLDVVSHFAGLMSIPDRADVS